MEVVDGFAIGSADDMAEMLGCSAHRVQQLVQKDILKQYSHGKYLIVQSVRGQSLSQDTTILDLKSFCRRASHLVHGILY